MDMSMFDELKRMNKRQVKNLMLNKFYKQFKLKNDLISVQ